LAGRAAKVGNNQGLSVCNAGFISVADMARGRRPDARVAGAAIAAKVAAEVGAEVRASRRRRRLTQSRLAAFAGISQARLAEVEAGGGGGAPLEVWLALAQALGRYLRFEFARDPQADLADAAHLDIQELVLRAAKGGGWDRRWELATRPADPARSADVALVDAAGRRIVLNECWNTFADLGYAARSSNRKLAELHQAAVALGGDAEPFEVGMCWVVRDTAANRALIARHPHIFATRFPGSSLGWLRTLTAGAPVPRAAGLLWCDLRATRLFARRASHVD
jgi:transcriptional regulator with XRE-family HTH domain